MVQKDEMIIRGVGLSCNEFVSIVVFIKILEDSEKLIDCILFFQEKEKSPPIQLYAVLYKKSKKKWALFG